MAWTIELAPAAQKDLAALDRQAALRIKAFLDDRFAPAANPRSHGKALTGGQRGLWRYRVGDYRLICDIQDQRIIVLVLRIGHRSQI